MANCDRRTRLARLLRVLLRDRPDLNRLSGAYDFTDDELDTYLELAVHDWNATPPPIPDVTLESHPRESILLFGACVLACESDAVREARNPFGFADGGVQASTQNKPATYDAALRRIRAAYEENKRQAKVAMNIGRGWSGVSSDYAFFGVG